MRILISWLLKISDGQLNIRPFVRRQYQHQHMPWCSISLMSSRHLFASMQRIQTMD